MMASDEVHANQTRCREILECKEQIAYWKAKLEMLESEKDFRLKLAGLRLDAYSTWDILSHEERQDKEFILAALESEELPTELREFSNGTFPQNIRFDKEILIKRVGRGDFLRFHGHDRLFVPPNLRGDKQVIMAILPKQSQVIECMSEELRDDVDILQAVLTQEELPLHFLQHFSDRLRNDKQMMLQVIKHPDGLHALAFCSSLLKDDKDFFIEAVKCGNHKEGILALQYASQRLKDDFEVVHATVCKAGLNLELASDSLRDDETIVRAATMENALAFRYCLPGIAQQRLLEDRSVMLRVVKHFRHFNHIIDGQISKELFRKKKNYMKTCLEGYYDDRELLLEAVRSGSGLSFIPESLQLDPQFISEDLQECSYTYLNLPKKVQEDINVAIAVFRCDLLLEEVISKAVQCCPELLTNREAIAEMWKKGKISLSEDLSMEAPNSIRNDRTIMMEAVKKDPAAFRYCSNELKHDMDFLFDIFESHHWLDWRTILQEIELDPTLFVELLKKTMHKGGFLAWERNDHWPNLLQNRDVAMAWLSNGGEWREDDFPEEFSEDKELLLTLLEHGNRRAFEFASPALKSDKDFMMKALSLDARVIADVSEEIACDEDLVIFAISKDPGSVHYYAGDEDFEFVVSLAEKVRNRLREYDIFVEEIIDNISIPDSERNCGLALLNQGPEVIQMYKKNLSAYLGLLQEDEATQFRAASEHLLLWGF